MKSYRTPPSPSIHLNPELRPFLRDNSTCSEDTEMPQDSSSATPPSKTGDFSALEFGEDVDTQADSTPDKGEGTHSSSHVSDSVEVTQKQASKSQTMMQTLGYQQRISVGVEHGMGSFQHKPGRGKKKKKKWNQLQNLF